MNDVAADDDQRHAGQRQHDVGRIGHARVEPADAVDGEHEPRPILAGQRQPEGVRDVGADGDDGGTDVNELEQAIQVDHATDVNAATMRR